MEEFKPLVNHRHFDFTKRVIELVTYFLPVRVGVHSVGYFGVIVALTFDGFKFSQCVLWREASRVFHVFLCHKQIKLVIR